MRLVRFEPSPVFVAFGVLTPGEDVEALLEPTSPPSRRMDRYGALGYAAARRALDEAGLPATAADGTGDGAEETWGVMIGSSLACWSSNARHHRDVRDKPATEHSPATFVRTVANAVNGDISIARRLGGPSETFVSGWTAGAEAIMTAGAALAEGRARWMLAGGVEAPDAALRAKHAVTPAEAAAVVLMGIEAKTGAGHCLRLRAGVRAHDAAVRLSLAVLLDAPWPARIDTVIVANTMPPHLRGGSGAEDDSTAVISLPERIGELGAAGAVAAVALAARIAPTGGVLIVARDPGGGTVALAVEGGRAWSDDREG